LRHQRADRVLGRFRRGLLGRGSARDHALHHLLELADQFGVGALRFALMLLQFAEDVLDPVDGKQNERDGVGGHRHPVAKLAHQGFGRMRQRFEARQAKETAGALDGVHQPEDVAENLRVVGLLLETHELDIDDVEALVGLDQEFLEKLVHPQQPWLGERWPPDQFHPSKAQCGFEAFNFSCGSRTKTPAPAIH
jgi:hypothetical protein